MEYVEWKPANRRSRSSKGCSFSPDGQLLVAGGPFWSGLRIYDTSTTGLLKTLDWNEKTLFSIAFSPDGELIALGNDEYSFDEQQGLVRLADLSACCSKDGRLTMRARGRLGLCTFFELFPELRRFSVFEHFSPQPPVTHTVGLLHAK